MFDQWVIYYHPLSLNHRPFIKRDYIFFYFLHSASPFQFSQTNLSSFRRKTPRLIEYVHLFSPMHLQRDGQQIISALIQLRSASFFFWQLKCLVNTHRSRARRHSKIKVTRLNKWDDSTRIKRRDLQAHAHIKPLHTGKAVRCTNAHISCIRCRSEK